MNAESKRVSKFSEIMNKFNTDAVRGFFMGKWYPIVVAALVLAGHTFGLEVYLSLVNVLLFGFAVYVTDSLRPLIVVLCTFLFQVSLSNSPGGPVWSDHYFATSSLIVLGIEVVAAVSIIVYMLVKYKVFSGLSFKKTPLLLSMTVLGGAFLLNGAFSSTWEPKDLAFGAVQAILFPLLFLLFYKGLRSECDLDELGLYVSYVAAVMGVLLAFQMADLYIFGNDFYGTIFAEDGGVIKERIHLGWATWNPTGISISVLIPAIFLGVIRAKHTWLYFTAATVTYIAAVLTFSRNALLTATLIYVACIIIACFVGERKRKFVFRIVVGIGVLVVLFALIVLWDKIAIFARDILDRGLSDNGRFSVWGVAIENFKSKPVFGTGFYYFFSPVLHNYSPAIPLMAHQTFLQLLSSMGFVGLLAYMYYRVDTFEIFVRKPTLVKSMLGLSALVLLVGSLLDNFIFIIFPLFFYSVALAIGALIYERQREEELLPVKRRSGLSRSRRKTKGSSNKR